MLNRQVLKDRPPYGHKLALAIAVAMLAGTIAIAVHLAYDDRLELAAINTGPLVLRGGKATPIPSGDGLVWNGQTQVGGLVPTASQGMVLSRVASTDTEMFGTYSSDTNHVGSGSDNEEIHWVARNSTQFNTSSFAGHATIMDAIVSCGQSTGSGGVTCTTLAPNATCATGGCTAYAYNSQFGILRHDGEADLGGPSGASVVQLGNTVKRFTVLDADPTNITPQLDVGVIASVDGFNMHLKNTATGVSFGGILQELDTTVTSGVRGGFILQRGAGGSAGGNNGGVALAGGAGYPFAASAANELNLYAEQGPIVFGADATGFTSATRLTANNHWVQDASVGAPTLDAGCTAGGGSAIVGNDNRFELTTGAASIACTVSFKKTWGTKPICVVTTEGGIALPTYTVSATQVVITVNLNAGVYNVDCQGQPGST